MKSSRTIKCEKLIYVTSFVLILFLAGNTSAAVIEWDGGGTSLLWSDAANWDSDTVPGSSDGAIIDIPDANCLIDSSINAVCAIVSLSEDNAPCYLNMTGGTLTTGGHIRIGEPSDSNGVFHMSDGSINTSGSGRLWLGINGTGTVIITGGEMTVSDKVECGKNSSGVGYIYVHGGTLNVDGYGSDDFEIGKYGTGTVTITDGTININDNIKLAQDSTGTGRLYLYGGTVNAGNIRDPADGIYGDPLIDITEGTLILPGTYSIDEDSIILDEYISNGWIIGYGGLGRVIVTYDADANDTIVTAALADPELSWNPTPSNFSEVQWTPEGITITWQPGEYAVSHDVYLGTNRDNVNDANNTPGAWSEYKGRQDPCSFDTGPLEMGMTYYWRIDEVNENAWAPPGSPWKGTVWEFTVADYIIVDDFEDYDDSTEGAVWATWTGWEQADNGIYVGHENPPYCEQTIVHGGGMQSMPCTYDNTGGVLYSEAKANMAYYIQRPRQIFLI
ncbi:MAG: hypothetical protein ACYTFW_15440 [Planctomycetota bacterium]